MFAYHFLCLDTLWTHFLKGKPIWNWHLKESIFEYKATVLLHNHVCLASICEGWLGFICELQTDFTCPPPTQPKPAPPPLLCPMTLLWTGFISRGGGVRGGLGGWGSLLLRAPKDKDTRLAVPLFLPVHTVGGRGGGGNSFTYLELWRLNLFKPWKDIKKRHFRHK
jgi:hypothetical protein